MTPTTANNEASEVAVVMASLVPALPLQTRADLKRMLDAELTVPSAACVRQQRLGLLLDYLYTHERAPTPEQYSAFRATVADGAGLPVTTLIEQYGGWARAIHAAVKLYERGTAARVPAAARPSGAGSAQTAYLATDVLDAIEAVRDFVGAWPSQPTFWLMVDCWRRLDRLPVSVRRLPSRKPLTRLFGSYAEALAAAQRRDAARTQRTADDGRFTPEAAKRAYRRRRRPR